MNHYDAEQNAIILGGTTHPLRDGFLVAGPQQVATPLRSLMILCCGLFGPITAMVWATLLTMPGLEAVRWSGAFLIGLGGIAMACALGHVWQRPWAVVVEHLRLGYRCLPARDRDEAQQLADRINASIGR